MVLRQLRGGYVDVGRLAMTLSRNSEPFLGAPEACCQLGRVSGVVICVEQRQPRVEDDLRGVHDGRTF